MIGGHSLARLSDRSEKGMPIDLEDRRRLLAEDIELEGREGREDHSEAQHPKPLSQPIWSSDRRHQHASVKQLVGQGRSGRRLCLFVTLLTLCMFLWAGWSVLSANNTGDESFPWSLDDFWEGESVHLPPGYQISPRAVPCHSHNDYWRKVPLFEALYFGCSSVEADVWLQSDGELFVGHEEKVLTPARTFLSLYVNPIAELLDLHSRGNQSLFKNDTLQTLVLLVDLKTDGYATLPAVHKQLDYLRNRNYLSYHNGDEMVRGPVTVVATGNTPFDALRSNHSKQDIFFDAPLAMFGANSSVAQSTKSKRQAPGQGMTGLEGAEGSSQFDPSNSYYASGSLYEQFGWTPWVFGLTGKQKERVAAQVEAVHSQALKARYWETPEWPRWARSIVWRQLQDAGQDILNADDLKSASEFLKARAA